METKKLGNSELKLSTLGLGTWAIGGPEWGFGWGAQEKASSINTILQALELGINWIDTAPIYGLGLSEEIVGEALKQWGKPVIIATKCGLRGKKSGEVKSSLKSESIRQEADDSLRRLGVEQIDLYQIHWPKPAEDIEEAFEAVHRLKAAGKIRYAGVSNFSTEHLKKIQPIRPLESLQSPLSLVERKVIGAELDWCVENNVGFLAYSPLQCGLLTGKVTKAWVQGLADDDWRKNKSDHFKEPKLSKAMNLVETLKLMADESEQTVAQLALKWVTKQAGVSSTIIGARSPEQIKETIQAASIKNIDWGRLR